MNKEDVLKELEVKNKEIYLNKLNIDLDNNNEILIITINNIINLFKEEVLNKVLEINGSNINKDNIKEEVNNFYDEIDKEIKKLLQERINKLKDNINKIDIVNYKNDINKESMVIINKLKKIYTKNINLLTNTMNELNSERIKEYLVNINYNKFIDKIEELFNNMNMILINNYIESSNKYKELNEKTLNK